ncbi:PepSY-associated TM helix domain-containing protein [Catenovulum adriaticum]|uniref:PepSY domain-containing protein n=1 Tax=Catenovulum adriaticum TaxID=2984846 RepID=A0ABY7AS65_9ALTE|nr:PepSY-associated TM helix domain-containing protein [Catenovulum sp. TS8]WAJ72324.1 PepSY domain-containing protein [Catenovulum sp. TS8]
MKKTLFKWHSYLALFALLPICLISITGSILVFKVEIDRLLMPEVVTVTTEKQQRQSMDELQAYLESSLKDFHLGTWEIFDDKHEADRVYVIKRGTNDWYKVHLDPYAGKLLDEPHIHDDFYLTDWILKLHYTLLLNHRSFLNEHFGVMLGFIYALILLFLGISGLILQWRFIKKLFSVRWKAHLRVMLSDIHKFNGVVISPLLLIVAFTGAYFNFVEIYHEEIEHAHEEPTPVPMDTNFYSTGVSIDQQLNVIKQKMDRFEPTYLTFPFEPDGAFVWYGDVPDTSILTSQYATYMVFDRETGNYASHFDARQADLGYLTLDSFRRLHFGNFAGLTSKILWCITGLIPLILSITGIYMWLIRTRKIQVKRECR